MPKKQELSDAPKESNHVLYRKYRPKEFAEVVGQDHIVSVLKQAAATGKIAHAYLFSGTRGTGKTTVARIFAEALGTTTNDLYEIDAASNNKVEDVHDLRENIRTLPFDSKYKVYILDEVHMLSKAAFNALLKTLEEPPAHVIFILATTELDKVPDTIVSRCQTFVFKKPTDVILRDLVIDIAKKEGFTLDESGAELISLLGDGSFRDTEGVLDKVLSFATSKKVSVENIESITGAPSRKLVYATLNAIGSKNIEQALESVHHAEKQNADMKLFVKLLVHLFRIALVLRVAPNYTELIKDMSDTDKSELTKLVKEHPEAITSAHLEKLLKAYQEMRYSFIASLPLELALIEILVTSA
jgi:DNA polymerase-3 subunit gamma/tau